MNRIKGKIIKGLHHTHTTVGVPAARDLKRRASQDDGLNVPVPNWDMRRSPSMTKRAREEALHESEVWIKPTKINISAACNIWGKGDVKSTLNAEWPSDVPDVPIPEPSDPELKLPEIKITTEGLAEDSGMLKEVLCDDRESIQIEMVGLPDRRSSALGTASKVHLLTKSFGIQKFDSLDVSFASHLVRCTGDLPLWIDISQPGQEEMNHFTEVFESIHRTTADDMVSKYAREKLEIFPDYLFVCLQCRDGSDNATFIQTTTLYLLIFNDIIITAHHKPVHEITQALQMFRSEEFDRDSNLHPRTDLGSWAPLFLILQSTQSFLPMAEALRNEVDAIAEMVFYLSMAESTDVLRRVNYASLNLTRLRRKISPKKDLLNNLSGNNHLSFIPERSRPFLRDAYDDIIQCLQLIDGGIENLSQAHQHYSASVGMEMAMASNEINITMKKLSGGAAVMLPLTLVAGLFGMNVAVPGQNDANYWWFFSILVGMVLMGYLIYRFFKSKNWM